MTDFLDQNLARWLAAFSVTMDPTTLAKRRAAVQALASSTVLDASALVAMASGSILEPPVGSKVQDTISSADPTLLLTSHEDLIRVLAGASIALRLKDGRPDEVALLGLLVESASYCGFTLSPDELPALTARTLNDAGRRQRVRLELKELSKQLRPLLSVEPTSQPEADLVSLTKAVTARDVALRAMTRRIEELADFATDRLTLLEEELDILWWARRGRNLSGERWESLAPAKRALSAAEDIFKLLNRFPAPSSVRSLVRDILGEDADSDIELIEIAQIMPDHSGSQRHAWLPLTTLSSITNEVGAAEVNAVNRMFKRVLPSLAASDTRSLLDHTEQLLRESQIEALM